MDNSCEAPEENPSIKTSSSSVIQVDSIYIALPLPKMKMDIRCSCEKGFSIRGYAASKRGSTPDISSIYPPGRELPPMEVPSFRYWRCCSCAKMEEEATGAGAREGNTAHVDERIPPTVQNLVAREQGLPVADANVVMRVAANSEYIQQGPTARANAMADAIRVSVRLPSPTPPEIAAPSLVPTAVMGANEAPAVELNAGTIDLQQQSEEINTAKEAHGKTNRPEVDQSREVEQSSGVQKRKRRHRSLADILGVPQSSNGNLVERALEESAGSKKVVSEGQQSPRRKRQANQQEEVPTEKASKRDKGKAIVTDAEDPDLGLVQSRGEPLFISLRKGQRDRTEDTPAPSRKKAKNALSLSEDVTKLIRELPVPPSATHMESQQQDHNDAGLSSGGLKLHTSSKHSKLGLDLSLGSSPKTGHHQNSAAKGKKIDALYGGSTHLQSDRSSKKGSLDLNEAASHTSAIPLLEQMDFLHLGPKEKNLDKENQEEADSRTDDIPMDIVELLAKQQFDRTNSDAGHSPIAHGSSDSARRFRDMELLGSASQWMRGYSGQPKPPAVGAQHGASAPSKAIPFSLSQPRSLPNVDSLRSALTNSLPPHSMSQRVPFAASGRSGAQYPSLFPPPPSSSSSSPSGFRFGGQPKQDGQQHRGKTISDIKADELKKTEAAARLNFSKPGSSVAASNGTKAFESYGNDSIPALQLMSLMDGRSSGPGPSSGSSKILSRPFSPCGAHPQLSQDERRDFLAGSIFSGQLHRKDPMPNPPTCFQPLRPHSSPLSGNVSFRTPEKDMSKNLQQKAGSSSSGIIRAGSDLYIPYLHDERVTARSLDQNHQRPTAESSRPATQTARVVPAAPVAAPPVARTGTGRHVSADGVCRTNKNPADFSVPEPGNMYTISSKDLSTKRRKKYNRKPNAAKVAAAGDAANNKGQQGNTSQGKTAPPKVGSS